MAREKSKMSKELENALKEYAVCIKKNGWKAGEPIIEKYKNKYKDFEKWALAIRLMLRADEILKEERQRDKKPKK